MDIKILLPYKVFAEIKNVSSVVAETSEGSFGFLPQRLDCIVVLVPGILAYKTDKVHYIAVDEGLLVKAGDQIMVSVRNAVGGVELGKLADTIQNEFKNISADQEKVRYMASSLETGFLSRLKKFQQV
ncbi:ATP synthase epsilon chain [Arcticibacter svalbardensis MN12-7]|uniref:ATP synthase epsilon chain n=1 Tax=Arcticibacter svalbardensis MN12-7 TaxID=1150600 RepID=R9GYX3_9SPHI|nr:F0F1 ATP synthase subunit epsilon [Arcticibacter svalbardensis]EOR96670.1 ATP synthase epsilon chain [Arcticibacter svalbardensis MN12-7]